MDHHGNPLIVETWPEGPIAADPPLPWDVYWEAAWARAWQVETGGQPTMFVYRASNHVFVHSFLVHSIDGNDGVDLETPYGYGGPLANTQDPEFLTTAWRAFATWAHDRRVVTEFVRFHPLIENTRFVADPDLKISVDRETIWYDGSAGAPTSGSETNAVPSAAFRRGVAHALKSGLRFAELPIDSCYELFRSLYRDTMIRLHADQFYLFSDRHWDALRAASIKIRLFGVLADDRLAAAALCLEHTPWLHYHLGASDASLLDRRPNNLLFHGLQEAARRMPGIRAVHFGGGSDASPDNSLLRFKAGAGGRRARFSIGRRIWDPNAYARLKSEVLRRHPELRQYENTYLQIHRLIPRPTREEHS
ncbi:MAG TPA: GNAT family N-acetyltransferase [Candidatus Ozemobacteraceae bacterium]|nr:GNAT family N-acetyltransferase [Candidatus Ozemobacteraceae bacterium]